MSGASLDGGDSVTVQATLRLRIVRDDNMLGSFSADFRKPDRLQQMWVASDGSTEWHDVEVIGASKAAFP